MVDEQRLCQGTDREADDGKDGTGGLLRCTARPTIVADEHNQLPQGKDLHDLHEQPHGSEGDPS